MYFIYVVNAKKGHLKGADKSTFCFCRQLGLICYLKDPDPEPEPDPERIRIGTASQNGVRNGSESDPQKKKCGSTTLVRMISTIDNHDREEIMKPKAVMSYNLYINGEDKVGQMLSYYL